MKGESLGCLRLLLVTVGCLVVAVVLLVLVQLAKSSYEYHYGFDRQDWLATGEALRKDTADMGNVSTGNRENMVADLMAHHLKLGLTRAQVLALLGPPERDGIEWVVPDGVRLPDSLSTGPGLLNTKGFNDWHRLNAQPDTIIRYRVGWDMIDPTFMRVEFDGKGRVKRYWVGIH